MRTVDNSTNILGVYELRSKLNDSVLLACTAGKSKLEHFSRHVFGQRCLLSYQTYYSQVLFPLVERLVFVAHLLYTEKQLYVDR